MTRRIVSDLEQEVYDRQRAARRREDRVLRFDFLDPAAPRSLTAAERRVAAAIEQRSRAAVETIRADRARMLTAVRRLTREAQR